MLVFGLKGGAEIDRREFGLVALVEIDERGRSFNLGFRGSAGKVQVGFDHTFDGFRNGGELAKSLKGEGLGGDFKFEGRVVLKDIVERLEIERSGKCAGGLKQGVTGFDEIERGDSEEVILP